MACSILAKVNTVTSGWTQLCANPSGEIPLALYSYQPYLLVLNAADATAAGAEETAGRVFLQAASTTTYLTFDPCKAWVKANATNAELYIMRQQ